MGCLEMFFSTKLLVGSEFLHVQPVSLPLQHTVLLMSSCNPLAFSCSFSDILFVTRTLVNSIARAEHYSQRVSNIHERYLNQTL